VHDKGLLHDRGVGGDPMAVDLGAGQGQLEVFLEWQNMMQVLAPRHCDLKQDLIGDRLSVITDDITTDHREHGVFSFLRDEGGFIREVCRLTFALDEVVLSAEGRLGEFHTDPLRLMTLVPFGQ
jgi:hypothetical protein